MTDPYTPVDETATTAEPDLVSAGEVRSPVEQFAARLRDLGASNAEVQAAVDHWDDLDPDDDPDPEAWTRARRDEFARAGDDVLLAALKDARAEYKAGHTTEAEAEAEAHTAALEAAIAEAQGRIAGNVESVAGWVADDLVRAEAVVRLELAPEGAGRKTLLGPLIDLLGWSEQEVEYLVATAYGQVGSEPAGDPEPAAGPDGAAEGSEAQDGAQGPASEVIVDGPLDADYLYGLLPGAQLGQRVTAVDHEGLRIQAEVVGIDLPDQPEGTVMLTTMLSDQAG